MLRRKLLLLTFLVVLLFGLALPELVYQNAGASTSLGTHRNGSLENAWLLPYAGSNFRFFSPFSYYILDRGYVHHRVYATVLEAYAVCAVARPEVRWRIMECSRKRGGRMWPHRTHRTGRGVDFMVPKKNATGQHRWLDRLGVWHYALSFDEKGRWSDNVRIDFSALATHLLALDDAARANGLRIKKVILKIDLQDDLFATEPGAELKRRGIYFVRALEPLVDNLHDDHYHVDFTLAKD